MTIHDALGGLIGNQTTQAPVSKPATIVNPLLDKPIEGVTATNVDNLSAARRSDVLSDEPTMFEKERERASTMSIIFVLKPPYLGKVDCKQNPQKYKVPSSRNLMGAKETPRSMYLVYRLCGTHSNDYVSGSFPGP